MANSLAERPDLDVGQFLPGSMWQRRRWTITPPDQIGSAFADRQNNYLRLVASTVGGLAATGNMAKYTVQTALLKFSIQTASSHQLRIILSSSGDVKAVGGSLPTTGYAALLSDLAPKLTKITNGTEATIGTSTGVAPNDTGTYWIRVDRTTTAVRFRIWADGTQEPGTWDVSVNDASLGAGVFQIIAGKYQFESRFYSIRVFQPKISSVSLPRVFFGWDGQRIPSGAARRSIADDPLLVAAPNLTGTSSHDDTKLQRVVTAPGNGSQVVSLPGADASAAKSFRANMRVLLLPEFTTGTRIFFGFQNGSAQYGLQQKNGDQFATVITPAGADAAQETVDWLNSGAPDVASSVGVEVNMRTQQMLIWLAEDQLAYYIDLPTTPAGLLVPTLSVTATTGTQVTAHYVHFEHVLESGSLMG